MLAHLKDKNQQTGKSTNPFYLSTEYLPNQKSDIALLAHSQKRPVLLVILEAYNGTPSPCSYIRLLIPLMSPDIQTQFEVRFASLSSALSMTADIVLMNRVPCQYESELKNILAHIRQMGAKLVYDIDDQLLDLPENHPEFHVYQNKRAVVAKLLSEADMVWTSTTMLSEALRPFCKRVATFENYLELINFENIPRRIPHQLDETRLSILYMGTATHAADLEIVLDALEQLHSEGHNIELYLIGISSHPPAYSWIKTIHPPASASNYPMFMQWLKTLKIFDLGIAPLEINRFNQCKSAIKFWDYTLLGIPTLASNVTAYNSIITDNETGYLADNNTNDWYKKLKSTISNKDQFNDIVIKAKDFLGKLYTQIDGAQRRKESISGLLGTDF